MIQQAMKLLFIVIFLVAGIIVQNVRADQFQQTLVHDGASRSYQLYLPLSYNNNKPIPLLMVLHGRPSSAQRMVELTDFNTRADQHGFIVVYPQGMQQHWNYLHSILGFKEQPNDSEFLLKVVADVKTKYSIDEKRVYVTGISNGGFMAQRLACYAPESFTAFASVAAGGYAGMSIECENRVAVNMLYMHGTADTKVPWKGLSIKDANGNPQLVTLSIRDSVKFWIDRNQCGPEVTQLDIAPRQASTLTRVKIFSSKNCRSDTEVVLYAIIGGGHNWPGVADFIPAAIAGQVNTDIHASDIIWSFFSTKHR
jgi:polyhydroxybutyrate depolymerase